MNTNEQHKRIQPINYEHYIRIARQHRQMALQRFAARLRRFLFRKPKDDQAALEIEICGA